MATDVLICTPPDCNDGTLGSAKPPLKITFTKLRLPEKPKLQIAALASLDVWRR